VAAGLARHAAVGLVHDGRHGCGRCRQLANLPSAVQGEIYADNPYFCFPFNEQYTSSTNTVIGTVRTASECSGLLAVNTAPGNQQIATYIDGNQPVATG
jgi:hypothetical protein